MKKSAAAEPKDEVLSWLLYRIEVKTGPAGLKIGSGDYRSVEWVSPPPVTGKNVPTLKLPECVDIDPTPR